MASGARTWPVNGGCKGRIASFLHHLPFLLPPASFFHVPSLLPFTFFLPSFLPPCPSFLPALPSSSFLPSGSRCVFVKRNDGWDGMGCGITGGFLDRRNVWKTFGIFSILIGSLIEKKERAAPQGRPEQKRKKGALSVLFTQRIPPPPPSLAKRR